MKNKFFQVAEKEAYNSTYRFRHGAVLVRGGSIVRTSFNKTRAVNFVHKHHKQGCGSLHAEIGCVLNITKDKTKGCDIYVVRILASGQIAMSKPCEMCKTVCQEMGIRRIFYTIDSDKTGVIKL